MERNIAQESYEMKLFLKENALSVKCGEYVIKDAVKSFFNLTEVPVILPTQYVDTDDKVLDNNKWTLRVRKKNTSSSTEIVYKKRYSNLCCVEKGLVDACEAGFDFSKVALGYECEADCGNVNKTLSFSKESKTKLGYADPVQLPDVTVSKELLSTYCPAEVLELVTANLEGCRLYGPVFIYRYDGFFKEYPVRLEIMPVVSDGNCCPDYVIELSFKTADKVFAFSFQNELRSALMELGVFAKEDVLKTQIVLDRY